MTISTTTLIDDGFKTIIKASGVGNETEQLLVDVSELLNATSEPKVSIANVYYEVEGSGKINFNFDSEESILEISGNGNYGLKPGEEVIVEIEKGKSILIQYLNMTVPDERGMRTVSFRLNGSARSMEIRDYSIHVESEAHRKAGTSNEIGAPMQGTIGKVFVRPGEKVEQNQQLFSIETMNTESVVTAAYAGVIKMVHLEEHTLVEQDDLIVEFENS